MNPMMILSLLLPVALLGFGYLIGHVREQLHLKSLNEREAALADIFVTDLKTIQAPETVSHAELVMGEAVIATDYFKSFASQLRNLVGGQVRSLESLMTRARREALVRMLEQARRLGAVEVHNVRLETSNVMCRGGTSKAISAEVFAFGTAIKRKIGK